MDANEYQRQAARTLITDGTVPTFPIDGLAAIVAVLKLIMELSEHLDVLKKTVFHEHGTYDPQATRLVLDHVALRAGTLGDWITRSDIHTVRSFQALQTTPHEIRLLWNVTGLVGEAGETARLIMDRLEGADLIPAHLTKELGDVEWYTAALCNVTGLQLGDVLAANIAKLQTRYPEGWGVAASQARVDVVGAAP